MPLLTSFAVRAFDLVVVALIFTAFT
ncbi:MAG TPA: hypothetical protein VHY34_06240 [Caulobacteraceae bacterium]|nr:hypothetical protein [Caulobacteraceae bacterium]